MKSLIEIGNKYPSSKNKYGFIQIYEKYFQDIRDKKINILEIGIDKGDSLRIWRDYFPNANICGLDIDRKDFRIDGVDFFFGDQSDKNFLTTIIDKFDKFDIIIDDGSHISKHIISSFNFLYPYLNEDGFYIIEDLQTSYIPRYGGSRLRLNKFNTSMNFLKRLADCVNYEHNDRPFFKKNKFDGLVKFVHFHQNIVFIKKNVSNKYYHPEKKNKTLIDSIKKFISKFSY